MMGNLRWSWSPETNQRFLFGGDYVYLSASERHSSRITKNR
jgi:hypothetical protein